MPRTPTQNYRDVTYDMGLDTPELRAGWLDAEVEAAMEALPDALVEQVAERVADLYGIDYELMLDADDGATIFWQNP